MAPVRIIALGLAFSMLLFSFDAEAGRRSLRIEFFAWDDAEDLDGPECPFWQSGGAAVWNGITFSGDLGDTYLESAYCQYPFPWEEFLDPSEYLSEESFPSDEAGLAAKVGPNVGDTVTAVRYTFIDSQAEGFQWAFYFFPGDITIVALYGLIEVELDSHNHFIQQGAQRLWDGGIDGFDGEYFCFEGSQFIGTWDGEVIEGGPSAGCELPKEELILLDGFEVESEE